eukprot:scaffold166932_cov36-Tisochrysis_lutea.AAC.2
MREQQSKRASVALLLLCGLALGQAQDTFASKGDTQGLNGFGHAFLKSFSVILATEIGAPCFSVQSVGSGRGASACSDGISLETSLKG